MKNAHTSQDLAQQIEQLVHSHLAAVRAEAEAAVVRVFAGTAPAVARPPKNSRRANATKRRTRDEIGQLSQRLLALVVDNPGEPMAALAPQLGLTPRDLQLPMTQLRKSGQVRSIGQRHQARYFPLAAGGDAAQ